MEQPLLMVSHLTKKFITKHGFLWRQAQSFTALHDISFSLKKSEILGFLGPNGAGKTTTIQILLGVLSPTSGSVTYLGRDFFTNRASIMPHIAFASTYVKLPGRLTVYENLDIYGRLYGLSSQDRTLRIEQYLKYFGMWDIKDKETGILSAGQTTRVMLAKAFLPRPAVVLLDEPTASLDPDIAREVRHFILDQQKECGTSILVTSHNMSEVAEICDRVLVLKAGSIIADDTPERLAASVAKARIHFITDDSQRLQSFAQRNNIPFTFEKNELSFTVDEADIAQLLIALAHAQITYSTISIDKPSLEDYFLTIADRKRRD